MVVPDKKWLVSVSTGDVEGAGTAAPVYLTVFGEDGDSGPLELGAPGDEAFERGTAEAQLEVRVMKQLDRWKALESFQSVSLFNNVPC